MPAAEWMLPDLGNAADRVRKAVTDEGMRREIPARSSFGKAMHSEERRNRIATMFGRLKDWRRVATRYDRCARTFLTAVALAATVMSGLEDQ